MAGDGVCALAKQRPIRYPTPGTNRTLVCFAGTREAQQVDFRCDALATKEIVYDSA